MDEKKKKLRRMALWLIAIFSTVFAITITFLWQITGGVGLSSVGMAFARGWPVLAVTGALCLIMYYFYKLVVVKK